MSTALSKTANLTLVVALAVIVSACGVRGSLVPPEGRDVLIEESDGDRFPPPAPAEETEEN
ncbi:lipoprotein [Pyruvatibacter sp.]|uniref:lipoprotein n=1 Tax=Pyruvatibacter sp. TaxID=1981328 RepID=UPI003265E764